MATAASVVRDGAGAMVVSQQSSRRLIGDLRSGRTVWGRLALLILLALAVPLPVLGNPVATEHVTARLVPERPSAVPGGPLDLLLDLEITPHRHANWRNPGASGEALRIDWTLPG